MPTPIPVGHHAVHSHIKHHSNYHPVTLKRGIVPILHKGDRGKYVRWAQILLNVHHASSPPLKTDELFGPKMLDAVIRFQKTSSLEPDGVVGLETWLKLQLITAELPKVIPIVSASVSVVPSEPKESVSVADWSLTRRFTEVVTKLTAKHLVDKTRAEFQAMLTPLNISLMVMGLVAWAVSHAFGLGEVLDLLAGIGVLLFGANVFRAAYAFGSCLERTVNAEVYSDLKEAGSHLAKAIAIVGVTAFFMLLTKLASGMIKRVFPEDGKAPPPEKENPGPEPKPDRPPPPPTEKPPDAETDTRPPRSAKGRETKIPRRADPDETRSLTRENESAEILAKNGYDVEQNPTSDGIKNPDYRLNGKEYADCYAPKTSNVSNILDTVQGKVGSGQASTIVVNLSDSSVSSSELAGQLAKNPIEGLDKLIIIDKAGDTTTVGGK